MYLVIWWHFFALSCSGPIGRKGPTESGRLDDQSRHILVSPQSRKTDSKLDVKIAHQPGQPDEPHPEIFPSVENVGKDAPGKSELIGEAKSESLESAPVLVPPNPEDALSSRSRRFFLPYLTFRLTVDLNRRSYVRGVLVIFITSEASSDRYPYYGAGYGDYGGGYYGGYGDYGGGYGDYGGGYGDYGGGYGDIDIGIDSDY